MLAAAYLALLGICEYWVFSGSVRYFWGGDDLFWFSQRFHSLSDFLGSLIRTDAEGWYRPLSNRSLYSLLFPVFGLNQAGYHVIVLLVFFVSSIVVFFFFRQMKATMFGCCAATFFFAIHSANAYTTFDGSYLPELFYATFYVCAFIFYLRSSLPLSLFFFVLSLLSKESAVTLPFLLAFHHLVYSPPQLSASRSAKEESLRIIPYFAVLGVYVLYVPFYLRVASGHYQLDFGISLLKNILRASVWAVNLPIGSYARFRHAGLVDGTFLYFFAILVSAGALWMFAKRKSRRITIFGIGWFLITCAPTLPISFYFRPYYLYLPLAGVSLIVGFTLEEIRQSVFRQWHGVAATLICLLLGADMIAVRREVRNEIQYDPAKGGTSESAYQALVEVKRLHPTIPRGSTIYVFNPEDLKTYWDYGKDALFKEFYNDPSLQVLYYSVGDPMPQRLDGSVIVLTYRNHHLVDQDTH